MSCSKCLIFGLFPALRVGPMGGGNAIFPTLSNARSMSLAEMSFKVPAGDCHPHMRQICLEISDRPICGLSAITVRISLILSWVNSGLLIVIMLYSTHDGVSPSWESAYAN
jgi:hypothetical protein